VSPAAQRAWRWFKRVAPWALAALVLTLVAFEARRVDWPGVWQALRRQSPGWLVAAAALSLFSYALYATFDLVGRRLTGHRLPVSRTLGIAAISYAFNLNLGSWVGSLALRLRLYTRWGLPAETVVQIVGYSMVTNWLGYLWVGGAMLVWAPLTLPLGWLPSDGWLRMIGLVMFGAALAYLALCRYSPKRHLSWRGRYRLELANGRLAFWQAAAGGANWLLIGAVVWMVLGMRVDYPTVLVVMLLAAVAGVVTHVPGNVGVLEALVVASLGDQLPKTELLAAMLAYRAAYYLLPFALALPAYAFSEAAARHADQRQGRAPERAGR
jgi:glycosyltransferase 2 family protein